MSNESSKANFYHYKYNAKYIEDYCKSNISYKTKYEAPRRMIVFGDIHGDYEALLVCLRDLAKVIRINNIDNGLSYEWTGKDTYVILLGDMLDRYRDTSVIKKLKTPGEIKHEEEKIIDLLNFLSVESHKVGGRVIKLLGNHELMNAQKNFAYVTPYAKTVKHRYNGKEYSRQEYFTSGNPGAKKIISCGTIPLLKVGDYIFVHGGIMPNIVREFDKIEKDIFEYSKELMLKFFNNEKMTKKEKKHLDLIDGSESSILWERKLGTSSHVTLCDKLREGFGLMNFDMNRTRIVVGHCPQHNHYEEEMITWVFENKNKEDNDMIKFSGPAVNSRKIKSKTSNINFDCLNKESNGQIFRTDVAMSRAFDTQHINITNNNMNQNSHYDYLLSRRPQVLEIMYDKKTNSYEEFIIVSKKDLPREWIEGKVKKFRI